MNKKRQLLGESSKHFIGLNCLWGLYKKRESGNNAEPGTDIISVHVERLLKILTCIVVLARDLLRLNTWPGNKSTSSKIHQTSLSKNDNGEKLIYETLWKVDINISLFDAEVHIWSLHLDRTQNCGPLCMTSSKHSNPILPNYTYQEYSDHRTPQDAYREHNKTLYNNIYNNNNKIK